MENMFALLGAVAPDELLIDQLEQALEKYKVSGDLKDVGLPCMLILSKLAAEASGGPMKFMEDLKKAEAGQKLLDAGDS
jgi:hypothetical protein